MRDQPNAHRQVRARTAAALVVTTALAACSAPGDAASTAPPSAANSPTPEAVQATPTTSPTSTGVSRPALPAAFPVMPGVTPADLPDDPTLIARWMLGEVGSAAYDFYVSALPAAGFSIVGLYPAERSALIRFDATGGTVWQIVAEQVGARTRITVQTDRP